MRNIMEVPIGQFYRDMNPFYRDQVVTHDDVKHEYRVKTIDEANNLIDEIPNEEYISVPNINNLSEVHIYRKTDYDDTVKEEAIWDGISSDKSWYDSNKNVFELSTANELKGFQQLVAEGVTFYNKEIKLIDNIDLAFHDWSPVGEIYKVSSEEIGEIPYSKYDITMDDNHVFKGTFNGAGHIIYGLKMRPDNEDCNFYGFFLGLKEAIVKNIVFADVSLKSNNPAVSYSAVSGVAENCIFSNIHVSGNINCTKPSGLCGIAIDTVFYNCKNSARLKARASQSAGIIVGGICQQFSISDKMVKYLNGSVPKVFVNCINEGNIIIDGANAKYLWAGHFFGSTFYKRGTLTFSFTMEKCKIHEDAHIYVINNDKVANESVYFGYKAGSTYESNNSTPLASSKEDLLCGLIGRVDRYIEVIVVKTTLSTIVNNMVISGTLNRLHSDVGENVFLTTDASPLTTEDCVYDLEPYFKYIKTVKI